MKPITEQPFYRQLKHARKQAGLSQYAAANLLKINYRTLVAWEEGKHLPPYPAELGCLMHLRRARSEAIAGKLVAKLEEGAAT